MRELEHRGLLRNKNREISHRLYRLSILNDFVFLVQNQNKKSSVILPLKSFFQDMLGYSVKVQLQRHEQGERRTLLVEIATSAALLCARA